MKKCTINSKFLTLLTAFVLSGTAITGCTQQPTETQTTETGTEATESLETEMSATQVQETELESEPEAAGQVSGQDQYEKNLLYLKTYFDLDLDGKQADQETFTAALAKITGAETAEPEQFDSLWMVKAAVIAADYEELALSYPEQKVTDRLAVYKIANAVDQEDAAYLAAALDAGLISSQAGLAVAEGAAFTSEQMAELLMAVASANGDARNYLGYSNNPQIASRLDNTWNSFLIFEDAELTELGKTAVEQGITTGYNLKNSTYDARFLPELTIQYGHDSIKHAHQLLALLNSENIVAKVQLEPKVSVYQYLLEWGPVPEPTPTYEVKQFGDDLYLVFAVEYDLMLEFENQEDMLAFNDVIEAYAKKYEGNEDAVGLIASSWWQPLYSTTIADMPEDQYHLIYDCVVKNDIYSIHPFALPENLEQVKNQFAEIAPDYQVEEVARYCNSAFYNYLKGDDYQ